MCEPDFQHKLKNNRHKVKEGNTIFFATFVENIEKCIFKN